MSSVLQVLHNYGVDVNLRGALGLTALHHACISRESSEEAVRLLLLWGADVQLVSATGDTALHYACQVRCYCFSMSCQGIVQNQNFH